MRIYYDSSKSCNYVMCKFQDRIFKHIKEITVKESHGRPESGRAGSSRISVLHGKIITFCSMNHIAEINISRVMMLFCSPIRL